MVLNRQTFKYQGKKLIEKVRFKPPLKLEQLFEEEGCFLYFKGEGAHLLSSNDKREMNTHEAVLIRCGRYFVDYIEKVEQDYIEVIAIHLYPDVLKKLYITELPALIESGFPVQPGVRSVFGHSMGGHGALMMALKNPGVFRSVSAFSEIPKPNQ